MGITVAIAEQRPQDIHAQCLGDKMLQALVHGYADKVWGCLRFPDIVFFSIKATCCCVCQCRCNSPSRFPPAWHCFATWELTEAPNCKLSFPQRFEQLLSGNIWQESGFFPKCPIGKCYLLFVRLRLGARGGGRRASSLEDSPKVA